MTDTVTAVALLVGLVTLAAVVGALCGWAYALLLNLMLPKEDRIILMAALEEAKGDEAEVTGLRRA